MALLPLDGESRANLERCVAGQSAGIHIYHRGKPGLWTGQLSVGAQFWNALADGGVTFTVAGFLGASPLLSFRPMRLLRRGFPVRDIVRRSYRGDSTAAVEDVGNTDGHWGRGRHVYVDIPAGYPPWLGLRADEPGTIF